MEKKEVKVETKEVKKVVKKDYSQKCAYDPKKDAQKVVPGLGVNVDEMLQTGIVKNTSETLENNGLDNPDQIVGRVRDVFDAMDAARIVKKYGRKPAQAQPEVSTIINKSESQPTNA